MCCILSIKQFIGFDLYSKEGTSNDILSTSLFSMSYISYSISYIYDHTYIIHIVLLSQCRHVPHVAWLTILSPRPRKGPQAAICVFVWRRLKKLTPAANAQKEPKWALWSSFLQRFSSFLWLYFDSSFLYFDPVSLASSTLILVSLLFSPLIPVSLLSSPVILVSLLSSSVIPLSPVFSLVIPVSLFFSPVVPVSLVFSPVILVSLLSSPVIPVSLVFSPVILVSLIFSPVILVSNLCDPRF